MNCVDIILDGKLFAARTWNSIPRIGGVVLLKRVTVWAEVTQVVWSNNPKGHVGILSDNHQWIQILCKTIYQPKGIL